MPQDKFVHLHVHSQYSLLDGACQVDDLVKKAVDEHMPALAMTDHGNMSGAIDFFETCVKAGIKPIIGCEAYLAPKSRLEKKSGQGGSSHLILLVKNETGYRNLTKLVSLGFLDGFYYRPRIDKELLSQYHDGLICSSACLRGEVAWNLREGRDNAALKSADDFLQIFGQGNFYLEMMDHGLPEQKKVNQGIMKIAKELNVPVIATNDVHYLARQQASAHEALLCIQTQSVLSDPNRMRMQTDQLYFKTAQEMYQVFDWVPEALQNTCAVAEKCNLKLSFNEYHLPRFEPPDGRTKEDFLHDLCQQGVRKRYGAMTPEINERLQHELLTIQSTGFISYFLIVWDFIHYARSKEIPVGPGRGSAAGSLVSYLLGITNLDPLKYGLLFERFLNPERSGMPDIDIDFCFERRGEVIDYVSKKYGEDCVAQIITFGTLQARAAVRDVGRVMSVPYIEVDRIAKLIPAEIGMTLTEALKVEPQLAKLVKEDSTTNQVIETAKVLEGLNRHASTHAAGVVIGDRPLTEYVPLYRTSDGQVTTGFAMDGIAKMGLLKMDFLGLRTLTVISNAVKWIKKTQAIDIDIEHIPLDDVKTYQMLSQANSFGIFQLESAGMRDLLRKSKPSCFEDLITILALYRPGPMGSGMLDDYIKRKRGDIQVKYPHPKLETVLAETFGIIVYQEQVMQMASVLAGFTMTQADHLRRAMSKKIASVMEEQRKAFVEGCLKTSQIKDYEANQLFDLIDYFSVYGFNRSHSAAYALISYQTAYLKANFTVEFMCALLTSEKDNTEKVVEYVKECEQVGIKVLPPDVNESVVEFSVVDEKTMRFGLLAVKNIGQLAIESIVAARESSGPFKSLFDFCERVDLRLVNKKVVESLVKCGAFDCLKAFRSQLMAISEQALELAANSQKDVAAGQLSFFGQANDFGGFKNGMEELPPIKEWTKQQILVFEKEFLGFYMSGHPLEQYTMEIKEFAKYTTKGLKSLTDGQDVKLIGIIHAVKLTTTRRKNERMAIITLEDLTGEVEVVVFPSTYLQVASILAEGEVVLVYGRLGFRDDSPNIVANDLKRIDEIYKAIKSIKMDLSGLSEDHFANLRQKLSKFPGKTPVYISLDAPTYHRVQILVGEELFVTPSEILMREIKELIGETKFSVTL